MNKRARNTTKEKSQGSSEVKLYITDRGNLYSDEDLKRFEIPTSRQLTPITFQGLQILEPPYDLVKLLSWIEVSVAHAAAVNTKVHDAVGIGWHLESDGDNETASEITKAEVEEFFNQVNENEDIIRLSKKLYVDYEGCGNAYLEVARGADGKVAALYQVPAPTMRLHGSRKLYVQRIAGRTVWFKKYGDERVLDNRSGKEVADGKGIEPEFIANEIIHLKQYTWRSPFYGLPEWLPAICPMFAEMKEKEYNLNFFSSFGMPSYAVILKGMDLNAEVESSIKKYFETEVKGNPHRTMVFATPQGGEIVFEQLSIERKEASFRVYRRDNRDDILTAHRVPPYRAGIVIQGQLAGGVAEETDRIYLSSVINPRQQEYEWILTKLIIEQGLQIKGWKFIFDDILVDDKLMQAQIDQIYSSIGVRSPNEIRIRMGEEPYEGGDAYSVVGSSLGINEETLALRHGAQGAQEGQEAEEAVKRNGALPKKAQGQITVLGKGYKYQQFLSEKARRRSSVVRDKIETLIRQFTKAVRKEFERQGDETRKFLSSENVLNALHQDAQEQHPELFNGKRKKFYERVSKVRRRDVEQVDKLIEGWKGRVKPESMEKILKDFAKRAGELGGAAGLANLGIKLDFNLKNPELLKRIDERGEEITGDITEKTLEDFRDKLVKNFYEEGKGPREVAREIDDLFEETYKHRAETIARTETGIAVSEVQHEAYRRNGVEKKRWDAFIDDRTRPAHFDANGQTVPVGEPFDVGGEDLMHPLDPSGSAENIINCRCVEIPVVEPGQAPEEDEAWDGD